MLKIHHVVEEAEDRWELDPARGPIKRRSLILRPSDVNVISHEGKAYKRGRDGAFDVPDNVGLFFLRHAQGWHQGPGPIPTLPTPEEMEVETQRGGKATENAS